MRKNWLLMIVLVWSSSSQLLAYSPLTESHTAIHHLKGNVAELTHKRTTPKASEWIDEDILYKVKFDPDGKCETFVHMADLSDTIQAAYFLYPEDSKIFVSMNYRGKPSRGVYELISDNDGQPRWNQVDYKQSDDQFSGNVPIPQSYQFWSPDKLAFLYEYEGYTHNHDTRTAFFYENGSYLPTNMNVEVSVGGDSYTYGISLKYNKFDAFGNWLSCTAIHKKTKKILYTETRSITYHTQLTPGKDVVEVIKPNINIRKEPMAQSTLAGKGTYGDYFGYMGEEGDWIKVLPIGASPDDLSACLYIKKGLAAVVRRDFDKKDLNNSDVEWSGSSTEYPYGDETWYNMPSLNFMKDGKSQSLNNYYVTQTIMKQSENGNSAPADVTYYWGAMGDLSVKLDSYGSSWNVDEENLNHQEFSPIEGDSTIRFSYFYKGLIFENNVYERGYSNSVNDTGLLW